MRILNHQKAGNQWIEGTNRVQTQYVVSLVSPMFDSYLTSTQTLIDWINGRFGQRIHTNISIANQRGGELRAKVFVCLSLYILASLLLCSSIDNYLTISFLEYYINQIDHQLYEPWIAGLSLYLFVCLAMISTFGHSVWTEGWAPKSWIRRSLLAIVVNGIALIVIVCYVLQ